MSHADTIAQLETLCEAQRETIARQQARIAELEALLADREERLRRFMTRPYGGR